VTPPNGSGTGWVGPYQISSYLGDAVRDADARPPEAPGLYIVSERPWSGMPDLNAGLIYVGRAAYIRYRIGQLLCEMCLTEAERKDLVLALTEMPAGSVQLTFNIGDAEAFGYGNGLAEALTQAKWKISSDSTIYPLPGLFIVLNNANSPPPQDAADIGKAFQKCGIRFMFRIDANVVRSGQWALVIGPKPME
jgi:hypothetical protein